MHSAEVQQQCNEILNVATTTLTVLQSDPATMFHDGHSAWDNHGTVWDKPSPKAWNMITATTLRALALLQWTHSPQVRQLHSLTACVACTQGFA